MHVVGADEFVYKCRAAAAAGTVNEGGDAGRAMRRAQLAELTGGKDCVFVDTGGSIEAAAAAVESALVTLVPALGFSPTSEVQVLTPGNKGPLGAKELNQKLRPLLNPRCDDMRCLLPPNNEQHTPPLHPHPPTPTTTTTTTPRPFSLWLTIAARARLCPADAFLWMVLVRSRFPQAYTRSPAMVALSHRNRCRGELAIRSSR